MIYTKFGVCLVLGLMVGCGQKEERPLISKKEAASSSQSRDSKVNPSDANASQQIGDGSDSLSSSDSVTDVDEIDATVGDSVPVVTPKAKHADDLALINSWQTGAYEGNDIFKLTMTAVMPFQ